MSNWQQGPPVGFYPGQGPPPAGFQVPGGYPQQGYTQPGYPQPGYPQPGPPKPDYQQSGGYGGYQPGAPPAYDSVYGAGQDPNMYGTNHGGEGGAYSDFRFSEKSIRHAFIRKVYGILMCQLVVSLGFIALFLFHKDTQIYVAKNQWLWGAAFAVMVITLFSIACCGDVRRKAPMNFIFLGFFTVSQGFLLGVAASTFHSNEVFLAVAITAVMKIVTLIYSCLGALLFSLYLIFDTQMMMGGNHKYSISPEEYVFAALTLYLDIVNIFMSILTIIGSSRD
ncbi:hypothetical protein RUM43_000758 [Polyplax serrata]|uniref:Protein lifeguard 1 n=1 Tax=Polyplax serrata TaxID=468196 RepID=A0AAN8SGS9_POLSC